MIRIGIAAVVVAAGSIVVAGPAQAAAKPCAIGTWKLTKQDVVIKGVHKGKAFTTTFKGAKKVKLKIEPKRLSMDFDGSTPQWANWTHDGSQGYEVYKGDYTAAVRLTGGAKGTFEVALKTAKGTARAGFHQTKPSKQYMGSYDVDKTIKGFRNHKIYDTLALTKGSFACSGKTLKITRKLAFKGPNGSTKTSLSYVYRR
ncbi:hypothetical protein GCM10027589_18980 [Actinocorallia lasiicapitis]